MQFINYNGNFYEAETPLFAADNRALKYGDGFFESIVMMQGRMPLLHLHVDRITKSAEVLQMDLPFQVTEAWLTGAISELALKNNIGHDVRIRIQFFREGQGLYAPKSNAGSYIITTAAHNHGKFTFIDGLLIATCPLVKKQYDHTSSIKTNSALLYVIAAQWAARNNVDDALILNTYNEVCEATSSNIIIVKGDKLITPPVSSGCVAGVMRDFLIKELNVAEQTLAESDVATADEVWLTNAVKGIQWVKQYKGNTYKNNKAMETTALLNNIFWL